MKKIICNVLVIVCSLSLFMLVSDCTCVNNALGAEFEFPEDLLSQTVEWEKCELFENQKRLRKAECADITVPLFWESPERGSMTIRVKRLKALFKAERQMWLLEGGPGFAGTFTFPEFMVPFARLDRRTDLYTLDHRGTGYSDRLGCPEQEAEDSEEGREISDNEWDSCIDHLNDSYNLDAFTVTNVAKDVGFLVELLQEENKEIFVMGSSYGSYWAHRYAQIFPDQAAGVILDSIDPPLNNGIDQFDILGNDVVKDFFDKCKADEFCNSKFAGDPWEEATNTFEKFKNGHCEEASEGGLTPEFLQTIAFGALDYWHLRIVLPAFYYRLERCNEKDVSAINNLLNIFLSIITGESTGAEGNSIPRTLSFPLMYHIGLSEEINENPISAEEMLEIDKTLLASSHNAYKFLQLLEKWPVYKTDDYYRKWASPNVPILMINGTLDQRTPIDMASIVKEYLTGPNQYFIEVPNANHGVVFYNNLSAPVKNIFAPGCGMQILLDYIKDPLAEPDTSCLDDLMQIDFHGNPLLALLLFGTWDIWENGITTGLSDNQIILMKEETEKIKHDLRQRWPRLR